MTSGNLEIAPVIESLQEEVNRLTNQQGVTKIIAVGHAGISIDQEIAQQVEGVDVVVGGRTNTFLYTGESSNISLYIRANEGSNH